MGRRADGGRQGVRAQPVYMVFLDHPVCLQNKKGDRHSSEAEPVPVPLCAEADAAEKRLVRPNLIASPFHDVIIWSGHTSAG